MDLFDFPLPGALEMSTEKALSTLEPSLAESLSAELARCGQCRSVCPVFMETGEEGMVARGPRIEDGIICLQLTPAYCKGCLSVVDAASARAL